MFLAGNSGIVDFAWRWRAERLGKSRMNRRKFIQTTAATAVAMGATGRLMALEAENAYRKDIGIQLYTLRNQLSKDTPGTLKKVAAAGYKQVELFGFPNTDAMVAGAKDAGLAIRSAHFAWDSVVNPKDDNLSDFAKILEKAHETGLTQLVIPYLQQPNRATLDDYKKVAAGANVAAEMANKAGIQLSYHNHNFEFLPHAGGQCGYDIFEEEFSPDMRFEIDVFWVKAAGLDPAALIRKLNGRVTQLHLKDLKQGVEMPTYASVPNDAFQPLGQGIIPMEPILVAAKAAGVVNCHVEQDQSPDPLADIRESMSYLRGL